MVKFTATTSEGGKLIGLGLEAGNIEYLKQDRPIVVKLREMDASLPELDLLIFYTPDPLTTEGMFLEQGMIGPETIVHYSGKPKD